MGENDKKPQPYEAGLKKEKVGETPVDGDKVPPVTEGVAVSPKSLPMMAPGNWEEEGVRLILSYSQELRGLWRSIGNLPENSKHEVKRQFLMKLTELLRGVEMLKGSARLPHFSVVNTLIPIERRFYGLVDRDAHGEFKDVNLVCALEKNDFEFLEKQIFNLESVLAHVQARGSVSGVLTQANRPNVPARESGDDWVFKTEYPYRSNEEYRVIQEVRKWLEARDLNSEMKGLKLLKERGMLATVAYDQIHQAGNHQFSSRSLDKPNSFVFRFAEEAGIGPKSVVIDGGSGRGSDAVYLAKRGAKVFAVDTSKFVLDGFMADLKKFYPELLPLITPLCEDTRSAILRLTGIQKVTHIYKYSSGHYGSPMNIRADKRAEFNILNLNREKGYLGEAMKTIYSDSARADRHLRITKDDGLNYSLDKEDRILRLYPDEDTFPKLVAEAGFITTHLGLEYIEGFDRVGETEEFREVIAKVPGTPNRRRRR